MAFDTLIVIANVYDDVDDAIADYDAVAGLYRAGVADTYDAAVVSHHDDGKVKIVKKHEEPTRQLGALGLGTGLAVGALTALFPAIGIGAGLVLGGAGGWGLGVLAGHVAAGMSRGDLKELGTHLDEGQSGLLVIAAQDTEARVDAAITRSTKTMKKQLQVDEKHLEATLDEATKSVAT
jgi:uncharacterized membrane protein